MVVPTYAEAENVEALAGGVLSALPGAEILFIDDASPDGTAERVEELAAGDRRVRLLSRPRKLGLGTAYLAGFRAGIEGGFDLVATMDADLSHDPARLPRMVAAAAEHDLVVGSRYVPGGGIENWGAHRRLLSRCANAFARRLLSLPVHDGTSGYRVYRTDALRALPLGSIRSSGYSFLEEITFLAARRGQSLTEVPIRFCDRRAGRSKISGMEILYALYHLLRLRLGLRPGLGPGLGPDLGRAAGERPPEAPLVGPPAPEPEAPLDAPPAAR